MGQPKDNLYLSGVFNYQDLGFTLRTQRFGEVTSFGTPADGSLDQTFGGQVDHRRERLVHFRRAVHVRRQAWTTCSTCIPTRTTVGERRPTAGNNNFGIFPYNQISPFGFNGAFYYGRLTFGF